MRIYRIFAQIFLQSNNAPNLGKQEIKAFLDGKKIAYEWAEHEAVYTIEDMVKLGLEDMQDVAKNLFLRDDHKMSVLSTAFFVFP
mgnify:CR=1 FL=1